MTSSRVFFGVLLNLYLLSTNLLAIDCDELAKLAARRASPTLGLSQKDFVMLQTGRIFPSSVSDDNLPVVKIALQKIEPDGISIVMFSHPNPENIKNTETVKFQTLPTGKVLAISTKGISHLDLLKELPVNSSEISGIRLLHLKDQRWVVKGSDRLETELGVSMEESVKEAVLHFRVDIQVP